MDELVAVQTEKACLGWKYHDLQATAVFSLFP